MQVTPYSEANRSEWNDFVRSSRNGTFLHDRNYMEYHGDRFTDSSLLVRDDRGDIAALLPANRQEQAVWSHGGLTYGGMLIGPGVTVTDVIAAFDAMVAHLSSEGIESLHYKTVPYIYHRTPADEDRYALFRRAAMLVRRDVLSVIDYRRPATPQERRMRSVKKARRAGLVVQETGEYSDFWDVLSRNLKDRYRASPVHSVDEISLLASRFPGNIRLFTATRGGETLGGVVVFVTPTVCHVQYNAATPEGKELGAQDVVFAELIERFRGTVDYFDFGISNEDDGRYLNEGLIEYKCGFGATAVVHDFYRIAMAGNA